MKIANDLGMIFMSLAVVYLLIENSRRRLNEGKPDTKVKIEPDNKPDNQVNPDDTGNKVLKTEEELKKWIDETWLITKITAIECDTITKNKEPEVLNFKLMLDQRQLIFLLQEIKRLAERGDRVLYLRKETTSTYAVNELKGLGFKISDNFVLTW